MRRARVWAAALAGGLTLVSAAFAAPPQRARDIGVPFDGVPGPLDAITDVPGVEVGQVSLISGDGPLVAGTGPVRTGVTVIFPRGRADSRPAYGGFFDLNGNGEMTGEAYLQDFGVVQGPIGLSNTNAIGQVYGAIQAWTQAHWGEAADPVAAETWDGWLNDLAGFHVRPETVTAALDAARSGPVAEGSVGGGVGMVCFGFKGGIGTASRRVTAGGRAYTVASLVQCNTGDRSVLRIAGAPLGREWSARWLGCYDAALSPTDKTPKCAADGAGGIPRPDGGSIIIVIATDAPLIPSQLTRLAKRGVMGLARLGSYSGDTSGDLIVSFTTAGEGVNFPEQTKTAPIAQLASVDLDPLYEGVVEATEEAIVDAMVASPTMTGADGYRVFSLPHDELRTMLRRYGRLDPSGRPAQ
jgi:L-aminopeptidase/D-esterase-like protein